MKKKVFLISPNSKDDLDSSVISYSMALGYLAAYAQKAGWEFIIKDCYCSNWEKTEETVKNVIETEDPSVIGINCITMNRMSTYKVISLARKLKPDIKIISGGAHPTIFPEHFLIHHDGDVVVMNEGEETFYELLKKFEENKPINDVSGIAYKKNGKIILTEKRQQIMDLESMPFMKHEYFLDKNSKKAYFFSSRGCPNNCIFCSAMVHWGRNYRKRSAKNTVDEIESVLKKFPKVEEIRFMDDTFTLDNKRVIEICKELVKRKLNIKWRCSGRVFPLTPEMVKWMDRSGCIMISFGVETGSPELLKLVGKGQTVDQIYNAMKTVYENSKNISPEMFLILGFPGENEKTVNETIFLIKRIIAVSKKPLILTAARMLEIYPGTDLYEIAKKKGMIDDEFWLKSKETPLYSEKDPKWLKKMRNKILFVNWTHAGPIPVVKLFFEKKMYRPRKIYNILRPHLKGIN